MDEWRSQFPGVVITRTDTGDRNYAQQFSGDARKLLYELKNLMKFRHLGQLKMTRLFMDGTVITAWSIFGHDFVNIDVSRVQLTGAGAAIEGTCTITLIDIPLAVPPMKDPLSGFLGGTWTAPEGDVSGIDYIKTYYSFDVSKCPTCQDIAWDFLFTYATPIEARHYFNPITNLDEPDNHTVYSLSPPAWGEMISHGYDDGGNYIIWKAYTETDEYSRTGLGIMLLKAVISDDKDKIICSQEKKIDVDCCQKGSDDRKVEIWWQDFGTCHPYIFYGDATICLMPHGVSNADLSRYSTPYYLAKPLYAIPDINGGCIPFEWRVTGPIKLLNTEKKYGLSTYFQLLKSGCSEGVTITLQDRCGRIYTVIGEPCCTAPANLEILYISLAMSCNQSQQLSAEGGCSPYEWSVASGGGTISQDGLYTAPSSNANCTDNPTIQLTDCCGASAQIKLAVNCYTGDESALAYVDFQHGPCRCNPIGCNYGACCSTRYLHTKWRCDGVDSVWCDTGWSSCTWSMEVACSTFPPSNPCYPGYNNCNTAQCGCQVPPIDCFCNTLLVPRTSTMKSQGCCPLNPLTGLSYD